MNSCALCFALTKRIRGWAILDIFTPMARLIPASKKGNREEDPRVGDAAESLPSKVFSVLENYTFPESCLSLTTRTLFHSDKEATALRCSIFKFKFEFAMFANVLISTNHSFASKISTHRFKI